MQLIDSASEREVRERYAAWLLDFLPKDYLQRHAEYHWDLGLRKAHQAAAFEAGWLQPDWPEGLGGQGLDRVETMAVRVESALRGAPKLPNIAGVNVAAPGIRDFGTEEQKAKHLVPVLRGDEWWALGMSEPEAGSDFGSLRTSAVRGVGADGAEVYRVNGQKIWTTQAGESRWATLYVRTGPPLGPGVAKHKGISCLLLDLESSGVTIREIRMASISDETFYEVFLDDVEVPESSLLGAEHAGWSVAMASLNHERDMIWVMNWVQIERGLEQVRSAGSVSAGSTRGRLDDDLLVQLGQRIADAEALRMTGYRALAGSMSGSGSEESSPEFFTLKLLGSDALQQTWELAALAAGPGGVVDRQLMFERQDALAATIYGGTSEVQRNIIGERVLGLPK